MDLTRSREAEDKRDSCVNFRHSVAYMRHLYPVIPLECSCSKRGILNDAFICADEILGLKQDK